MKIKRLNTVRNRRFIREANRCTDFLMNNLNGKIGYKHLGNISTKYKTLPKWKQRVWNTILNPYDDYNDNETLIHNSITIFVTSDFKDKFFVKENDYTMSTNDVKYKYLYDKSLSVTLCFADYDMMLETILL